MSPPPYISPLLKLHSSVIKTTICRSPPPLSPSHLTSPGLQPIHHHLALITPPPLWTNPSPLTPITPPLLYLWVPTNPPPLGHNHPTTPTHQLTHHPPNLAPTNPPPLTSITPPPLGTSPSLLDPSHHSVSSGASAGASSSARDSASISSSTSAIVLEIIEKFYIATVS